MSINSKDVQTIITALDKLAVTLTTYEHQWTDEERNLYEKAIAILTSVLNYA